MQFLKNISGRVAWIGIVVLLLLCVDILSTQVPAPHWLAQWFGFESASRSRVVALLAAYDGPVALDPVEKSSNCAVDGALPDHACTPGAIFANATLDEICVSGYSTTVRNVPIKLKKQVYASYDIAYPQPTGSFEVDHLIPLALGGSNDAANLFPEARDPAPGFKEKDIVEVYLHEEVCAGRIDLAAAQAQIAHDWVAVYQALDPNDIAHLKAKYKSWSN